jgi:outer membrane receptor protein involved in Fe transport
LRARELVVTLAVCTFSLMPAGADGQTTQNGSVSGTIRGRRDGLAVRDAVVTVDGTSITARSNDLGRFTIDIPPGTVVLAIEAPGFLPTRSAAIQVPAGAAASVNFELEPAPSFIERVQVTATKIPLQSGDVAAQTDVVDRETIDHRGDQTLTQAIAHVPGAVVSTQLGIFDSVMLRGLPRGDPEFTSTLLLVDGVPQTLSNNGARVVALPINDVSSIEIVRGPGSALYGRTAIGGSVNVLTAEPTAVPELRLDLAGGQFDTFKGVAKVSGPAGRWGGYYASVGADRSHGYFVNKTTSDFTLENTSLFGKLSFAPGPRGAGTVTVGHVDSDNSTPTNEPIIEGSLLHEIEPLFDRFTNFNIPGRNYQQRESRVTLNYSRQLNDSIKLHEVFGYRAVQHKFVEDGDFIGSPFDLNAHTVTMYPFSQQLDEDIFYQELRAEIAAGRGPLRGSLLVGGSYERNNGSLDSDFIFNDPDLFGFTIDYLNPVIPPRNEWQHDTGFRVYHLGVTGLFAQYIFEPTPRFSISAGGRYDRLAMDNSRDGGPRLDATFQEFSPKASVTYKLIGADRDAARVNIYGAYSQSFLPPRRPSSLVPADVPLDLQPEDIANYEGGLKGSLLNGRVSFEATYFRMTEDGVVLSTRQGPFFLPTNAGELRYKGFETGVTAAPRSNLTVYMNASFYRNRFGAFVIQEEEGDTDLTGNRLPISPDYVINEGASVTLPHGIQASVDIKHVGDVQTNRDNTFALPAYTVLDAAVSWQRGPRVRVTLSGHNLLNEEYYWNGDGETADPGRPRQILISTSLLFR